MNTSMLEMKVATAPSCARPARGRGLGYAVPATAIFAATGGFWTTDPHTTKQHHSLRERRT